MTDTIDLGTITASGGASLIPNLNIEPPKKPALKSLTVQASLLAILAPIIVKVLSSFEFIDAATAAQLADVLVPAAIGFAAIGLRRAVGGGLK